MNRRLILTLVAAVAAPAALALAANAQPAGPPPAGHGAPHGGPEMKAMHEAMMKQHAEDLKTVLRLRPDQEPALNAFLQSHGPKRMEMRKGGPDGKPSTTPERLDDMAKHQAAMAAEMEKHRAALAKFYAALNPEQQKAFDALQRLQHGGHGGPGMRRIMIHRGPGGAGGPAMMHGGPH